MQIHHLEVLNGQVVKLSETMGEKDLDYEVVYYGVDKQMYANSHLIAMHVYW